MTNAKQANGDTHQNQEDKAKRSGLRRWLKRLGIAALCIIALLVGIRLIWGHQLQGKIDERIEAIHAQGDPILLEDLAYPELADEDNGAWHLRQAIALWPSIPGGDVTVYDSDWYLYPEDGHPDPITDNAAYLDECEQALEAIRHAEALDDADWGVVLERPVMISAINHFEHYSEIRMLARLVADAAERAFEAGRYAQALEITRYQYTLARHIQARPTGLIDCLVARSIMAIACDTVQAQLPLIDPAELREGPTREAVDQLIAALSDADMMRQGYIDSIIFERLSCFDMFRCLRDGTELHDDPTMDNPLSTPGMRHLAGPLYMRSQIALMDDLEAAIQALRDGGDYDTINAVFDRALARFDTATHHVSTPLLAIVYPAYGAANATNYRGDALCGMAAIALAIRLYEADHGQRPDALEDLVPDYLAELPADPFSSDGSTFAYVPAGVSPQPPPPGLLTADEIADLSSRSYALIYSLNTDGTDQGARNLAYTDTGELDKESRFGSWISSTPADIWFVLDPMPEPIVIEIAPVEEPAAEQPVEVSE